MREKYRAGTARQIIGYGGQRPPYDTMLPSSDIYLSTACIAQAQA